MRQVFRKNKKRKAPGPDGVTPVCLKSCADQLAPIITQIFIRSLELCKGRSCFKRSGFGFSLLALLLFGRSCLLLCTLLPIFVLFSDLSKILTSADQHSAQTTHFFGKRGLLARDASIRYSGSVSAPIRSFSADRVSERGDRSKSDIVCICVIVKPHESTKAL